MSVNALTPNIVQTPDARAFMAPAPEFITKHDRRKNFHVVANAPAAYLAHIRANGIRPGITSDAMARWAGGKALADALDCVARGDNDIAQRSERAMAAMEDALDMPTATHITRMDVAGGYACVPAHLAGAPMAMRRRVRAQADAAPLGIVVDTTSSAGISAEQMLQRGAAVLALVRLLADRRPTECWALSALDANRDESPVTGATLQWVRIDTTPLDLARAGFILGHVGFARMVAYNHASNRYGYMGGWPYGFGPLSQGSFAHAAAQALPHLGESVFIPAPYGESDDVIADPIQWVRDHLARHSSEE